MQKLISIIIPVYNVEAYIEQCLLSVLNQSYPNFEILCIDDGSSDQSADIIKTIMKNDERINYYYQKNQGQASARNHGLHEANGDYICFIDSDDFVERDFLKILLDSIQKNKAQIVMCDFNVYTEFDNQYQHIETGPFTSDNIDCDKFLITVTSSVCNKLFDKNLFSNLSFLEGVFYEDVPFTAQAIKLSVAVCKVDLPLYNYRVRSGENLSTMQKIDDRVFDIFSALESLDSVLLDCCFEELEMIYIRHLLVHSPDRFYLRVDGINEIISLLKYMDTKFPNWRNNRYLELQSTDFIKKLSIMKGHEKQITRYFKNKRYKHKLFSILSTVKGKLLRRSVNE